MRRGDQPELLLARIADFIWSGGDVERVVAALPGDDERGDRGLLIEIILWSGGCTRYAQIVSRRLAYRSRRRMFAEAFVQAQANKDKAM